MEPIEIIRKEVERRMLEDYNGPDKHGNEIAQGVCAGILEYIDTMPKEKSYLEKTLREIMGKLTDDEKTTITTMLMMGGWGYGGFGGFLPLLSSMVISNAMNAQPNKEEKE